MKRAAVAIALFTAGIAGCATLRGERGPSPGEGLRLGLATLAEGDYARARPLLERVYLEHGREPEGRQALLAIAAAELDARNPERRLGVGAELAGRYLSTDSVPAWAVPVAESLYLLAVELGGRDTLLAPATENRQAAPQAPRSGERGRLSLPRSEVASVPERIRRLTAAHDQEREELQKRVAALEQRLAASDKELKDAQSELERIRQTLKR